MPTFVFAGSGFFGVPVLDGVEAARVYVKSGSKEPKVGGATGDGAIHSFSLSDDGAYSVYDE